MESSTIEEYQNSIKLLERALSTLKKGLQEKCTHTDAITYGSSGDSLDGDKYYWASCKICGKYASYCARYDTYRIPLDEKSEKDREEYYKVCKNGRKV
jgi:hypothetical protein